jgi:hypothetical protein
MRKLFFIVAVFMVSWPVYAEPFRMPENEAEKALDKILRIENVGNIRLGTAYTVDDTLAGNTRINYADIMTPELFGAILEEEQKLVEQNCGGKYREGDICGLDYDPVTCTQDFADHYLYNTLRMSEDTAQIEYTWPSTDKAVAEYRLIKMDGRWKIDGIQCAGSHGFNNLVSHGPVSNGN